MSGTKPYEEFSGNELQQILGLCRDKSVQKEQDKILLQPLIYNQQVFGQEFLSKLLVAFNHWLNVPIDKLKIIDECVLMVRDNGILMDAIENDDSTCLRRGAAVAHSIYGVAITINTSGFGYFLALEKLFDLNHPDTGKIYTEQILEIHRGQGMDIYYRDNFICPSESDYKQMAIRKTGGLFALIVRLMQLFSDDKNDLSKLTTILALYYHIRDDYCGLISEKHSEIKSFAEDITDGKFNFPIIHAVTNQKIDHHQLSNILRQRTKDVDLKIYCVQLLEQFGSFKYTRKMLRSLDEQARNEVAKLGSNAYMMKLVDDLLTWNIPNETSAFRP